VLTLSGVVRHLQDVTHRLSVVCIWTSQPVWPLRYRVDKCPVSGCGSGWPSGLACRHPAHGRNQHRLQIFRDAEGHLLLLLHSQQEIHRLSRPFVFRAADVATIFLAGHYLVKCSLITIAFHVSRYKIFCYVTYQDKAHYLSHCHELKV